MFDSVIPRERAVWRRTVGAVCCLAAILFAAPADAKSPISCGRLHGIERGDTLFRIAVRAYGDGWKYKSIYAANRDLLPDEKSIEIGDQVLVPCLDGTGPATRQEALAQATAPAETAPVTASVTAAVTAPEAAELPLATGDEAATETATAELVGPIGAAREGIASLVLSASPGGSAVTTPRMDDPQPAKGPELAAPITPKPDTGDLPVRLLTGDSLVPFAGETLRQGGLATEIVAQAMRLAAPEKAPQIAYVRQWEFHLHGLLLSGALDVGFPWVRPDCTAAAALTPQAQLLCAEFAFSRPFLELPIAVFARADAPVTELTGRRVCRPPTAYAFDMDGGIAAGSGAVSEATASACFARLLHRDVDAVELPRREAEAVLRQMGIEGSVREIKALASTRTLHAVAPKSNRTGLAYLALIDAGLEQLMVTGAWFRIVTAHQSSQLALAE